MKLREKQINAVLALPGPKRFAHFIKVVADQEQAWGLHRDGWVLYGTDEGEQEVLPLWPASEYAQFCAVNEWEGCEPKSIPISELIDELLPDMKNNGILPAVFPTPGGKGVVVSVDELLQNLGDELLQYE